jgi:hypothetical protein
MDDDTPLNLRSLADVESPDALREALREFRRRALTRYVWVLLAVVVLIVAALLYPPERSLVDRIETADESALVGYSVRAGESTWTLVRVADLGETLGLEWLVWPVDARGRISFPVVEYAGVRGDEGLGELVPFEVSPPRDGVLRGTIRVPGAAARAFSLDLGTLGVPPRFWRST